MAVNSLKKSAKGDEKLASEKRVYLYVEAEAATTTAKFPKGQFFYSKDWVIGSCGANSVNATSSSFGNGVFDGYSIVVGHEYSEAVTDPDNFFSVQDGWNDVQTSENADKCAWIETQNITLAGHRYAIQPTWSNEAFDAGKDGCAVAR